MNKNVMSSMSREFQRATVLVLVVIEHLVVHSQRSRLSFRFHFVTGKPGFREIPTIGRRRFHRFSPIWSEN